MFLIRLAFWLGVVVMLLPTDEAQQAKLYTTAVTTVERATTFCERNPDTCAAGAEFWASFVKKAEFGGRMVSDLVKSGVRKDEAQGPMPMPVEPVRARGRPEANAFPRPGTLNPDDMAPAWRGQPQRAGT